MNEKIFKAYDIRGIYGKEIILKDVYKIIDAIIQIFKPRVVSLAHDARKENKELYYASISFLSKYNEDVKVLSLGKVPTTIFYIYNIINTIDLGIIFTASHNPRGYVGIKIVKKGKSISFDELQQLKEKSISLNDIQYDVDISLNNDKEEINLKEIVEQYIGYIKDEIKDRFPLICNNEVVKVIFDTSNGSFSSPMIEIFINSLKEIVNLDMHFINNEDDGGMFKAHLPDTSNIENYKGLIRECISNNAWGIGFDGDGDRFLVVTPSGKVILPEFVGYLIAKYYHLNKILVEVSASQYAIKDMVEEGYDVRMIRTGHTFMEEGMVSFNRDIGFERSGHFYFKSSYGMVEDAVLGMILFLRLISCKNIRGEILQYIKSKKYFSFSGKITLDGRDYANILNRLKEKYSMCEIMDIDGIRVYCEKEGFWFLIRKSNTEDIIRIIVEGDKQEKVIEVEKEITRLIQN